MDEGLHAEVLEGTLAKAKEGGGPMHVLVETLVVLGTEEREKMLKWYEGEWYEETVPKGIRKARRDVGIYMSDAWLRRKLRKTKG